MGDERAFRQEFPATAREAFLVTGDGFFDAEALVRAEALLRAPDRRGTFVQVGDGFMLQPGERGYIRVWEPPDPDGHYVIGADTAEGRMAAATDQNLADPEGGGTRGSRRQSPRSLVQFGDGDVLTRHKLHYMLLVASVVTIASGLSKGARYRSIPPGGTNVMCRGIVAGCVGP